MVLRDSIEDRLGARYRRSDQRMCTALQTAFVKSKDQGLRNVRPSDRDEVALRDLGGIVDEDAGKLLYPLISQFRPPRQVAGAPKVSSRNRLSNSLNSRCLSNIVICPQP